MEKLVTTPTPSFITQHIAVDGLDAPCRVDVYAHRQFPDHSRSYFQRLIDRKLVSINGATVQKHSATVKPSDTIAIDFPTTSGYEPKMVECEDIGVEIVDQHKEFHIIYKPPGLMVHPPSPYTSELTLVDWLVARFPELTQVGATERPGIVHRLDRNTSGLMIIPRNPLSHALISDMFKYRTINKTYVALVKGHPDRCGTIDLPIARDPHRKTRMTHTITSGREAITHYTVLEYFGKTSLLQLKPVTGRTHQLRVHCAAIGHPIVGDTQYGTVDKRINRQALHAQELSFSYKGVRHLYQKGAPHDFLQLVEENRLTTT